MTRRILTIILILIVVAASDFQADAASHPVNVVYEQIELISLAFRLADFPVFNSEHTEYQRSLLPAFREFAGHPIVARTVEISGAIGFDAPISFGVHLEKVDGWFQFVDGARIWEYDTRWTQEMATEYLMLLNDFYAATNFGAFFEENMPYFEWHSRRLYDELISKINFDWFDQFGFVQDTMRIIIRPSGTHGHFGPTFLDTINYAVMAQRAYYGDLLSTTAHEFAHSFANPIAEAWYEEDEEFRNLIRGAASTVTRHNPWYSQTLTVAREYVTRAYTVLYLFENHDQDLLGLLMAEFNQGFFNIETVYAMITEHEPIIRWHHRVGGWFYRNQLWVWVGVGVLGAAVIGVGIVVLVRKKRGYRRANKNE
jgi:hypothetical protein